MSAMAVQSGGVSLPRKATAKLQKAQKLTLAEMYLGADDEGKEALIRKWGRGRVRRSLTEYAREEHLREYMALRERDNI